MNKLERIKNALSELLPWEISTPKGYTKFRGPQGIWMYIPSHLSGTKDGLIRVRDMFNNLVENYDELLITYKNEEN